MSLCARVFGLLIAVTAASALGDHSLLAELDQHCSIYAEASVASQDTRAACNQAAELGITDPAQCTTQCQVFYFRQLNILDCTQGCYFISNILEMRSLHRSSRDISFDLPTTFRSG
jgi:hypothetical protein